MYNENHAIVAWFKRGFADAHKTNKKSAQNVLVSKAPSERGLSRGRRLDDPRNRLICNGLSWAPAPTIL